jgi:hypothetical protein
MKGDPPSLRQILQKYGHPADSLAASYFDALERADEHESTGEADEARSYHNLAEECRKELAKYGFVPEKVDGTPKAARPR